MSTLVAPEKRIDIAPGASDGEDFATIYQRHAPGIYTFAYRRLGRHQDAEDAASQTFAQAWAAFPRFRERDVPVEAWLYRVAANVIVDMQRRRKVRTAMPLESDDTLADSLSDGLLSPEEAVERNERYAGLRTAIRGLAPDYQQVIGLRYGAGLSGAEAGRVMGRSEGAVKLLLHRAVQALRRRMQDYSTWEDIGWPETTGRLAMATVRNN